MSNQTSTGEWRTIHADGHDVAIWFDGEKYCPEVEQERSRSKGMQAFWDLGDGYFSLFAVSVACILAIRIFFTLAQ